MSRASGRDELSFERIDLRHKSERPQVVQTCSRSNRNVQTYQGPHIMANHIFASVGAWTKQHAPVGPYSPIKGRNSIAFCGGALAFARSHSVDASSINLADEGKVVELTAVDGLVWYARAVGSLIFAFRDQTAEEIEKEIDLSDMAAGVNVERVRLDACRIVAFEMSRVADSMRTEQCPSRQRRRAVKRRMLALTTLQRDLLSLGEVNARALRAEMSSLGLPLPRRDYWGVGAARN